MFYLKFSYSTNFIGNKNVSRCVIKISLKAILFMFIVFISASSCEKVIKNYCAKKEEFL